MFDFGSFVLGAVAMTLVIMGILFIKDEIAVRRNRRNIKKMLEELV